MSGNQGFQTASESHPGDRGNLLEELELLELTILRLDGKRRAGSTLPDHQVVQRDASTNHFRQALGVRLVAKIIEPLPHLFAQIEIQAPLLRAARRTGHER